MQHEFDIDFDMTNVKEPEEFGLLPAGYYKAKIVAHHKKRKSGADINSPYYYLELKIKITEGTYKNRVLFHKLNVVNENEKIQEWHRGVLKKILRLCGDENSKGLVIILDKPLMIETIIKPFSRQNPKMINEIKSYLEINDALLAIKYQMQVQVLPLTDAAKEFGLNDDIPF